MHVVLTGDDFREAINQIRSFLHKKTISQSACIEIMASDNSVQFLILNQCGGIAIGAVVPAIVFVSGTTVLKAAPIVNLVVGKALEIKTDDTFVMITRDNANCVMYQKRIYPKKHQNRL